MIPVNLNSNEFTQYAEVKRRIEELYKYLELLKITPAVRSHFERDYVLALDCIDDVIAHRQSTFEGRRAIGGFNELYQWIWSVKDSPSFECLVPHLGMLSESAIGIASEVPMISEVTRKQDDKSNKLIETLVAMYAVKVGTSVDIDDPVKSSNGDNPDVMFRFDDQKIAIACKTLRGSAVGTLLGNIQSAAKQIRRAACDKGYIAINAMNILPHGLISQKVFSSHEEPFAILTEFVGALYRRLQEEAMNELELIFDNSKVRPVLLTFVHSSTRLHSERGSLSTMLKGTFATELRSGMGTTEDFLLLNGVNDFVHHRL